MTNSQVKTFATATAAFIGFVAVVFGIASLRAWLLSLAVALFAPAIVLTFWQWLLVVVTIHFLLADLNSSKK